MTSFIGMKIWITLLAGCILFGSCSIEQNEDELYDLLLVCYNDYYELKNISASDTLQEFEHFLIQEGHLKDNSGKSYLELLNYLQEHTYLKLPLKKIDFTNTLLYDNPSDLLYCAHYNFTIDSTAFLKLDYYECADQIAQMIEENESIDIHEMFEIYGNCLDEEEIVKPFVRESMLQFFYRWYFTSKYNRDIQFSLDEAVIKSDSLVLD
jgi:hypothetical protein